MKCRLRICMLIEGGVHACVDMSGPSDCFGSLPIGCALPVCVNTRSRWVHMQIVARVMTMVLVTLWTLSTLSMLCEGAASGQGRRESCGSG